MARRRSGIQGISRLRKTLRRMDPEITKEVRAVIRDGGEAIKQDMIAAAPIDDGDLVREIEAKYGRDGLTVVVGPGAKYVKISDNPFNRYRKKMSNPGKHALFQFFKAYWYEFGTKGSVKKNIPPQPARPFIGPAYDINRAWILGRAQKAIRLALQKASTGNRNG